MKNIFISIISLLIFFSCAPKPIADFIVDSNESKAPAKFRFIDRSQNSDSIIWSIDKEHMSTDSIFQHRFLLSGNYRIQLKASKNNKSSVMEKEVIINAPDKCYVLITTEYGNMLVQLYDETPKHRDNFLKLIEENFYENLLFHRVINRFMVQGGDPDSRDAPKGERLGGGGPGYQIPAEFKPELVHMRGALAAARMGDAVNPEKKSSGSQFYIVHGQELTEEILSQMETRKGINYPDEVRKDYLALGGTPFLDQEYTVFGRVVEGLDVLDKIANVDTDRADRPLQNVNMKVKVIK